MVSSLHSMFKGKGLNLAPPPFLLTPHLGLPAVGPPSIGPGQWAWTGSGGLCATSSSCCNVSPYHVPRDHMDTTSTCHVSERPPCQRTDTPYFATLYNLNKHNFFTFQFFIKLQKIRIYMMKISFNYFEFISPWISTCSNFVSDGELYLSSSVLQAIFAPTLQWEVTKDKCS